MQGQVLNKITNEGRRLYWGLVLANIWTETSGYVHCDFPSKVLVGHNNEVYYCKVHLCTGDLKCPNYSWDPNWVMCTNLASESSMYKNGNFLCLLYFFPLQPAWPPHPPGSFTPLSWPRLTSSPCVPLLSDLKGTGIIFSYCLCWISLSFSPPLLYKRFYTFWVSSWEIFCLDRIAGAEIT